MKGDTTPMRVLLVVDSSLDILEPQMLIKRSKWMAKWLESTGCARMKVPVD